MSMWVTGISAAVSVGTGIYAANQTNKAANKALDANKAIVASLKYEPIDIEKLKADATKAAIENATNSLALERTLQPDIANTRTELARQTSANLALGGNLDADTINRVTSAGRVIGARSGGEGSSVPLTASLLGLSSMDLASQRRAAAGSLLAANPLPVAGLDPGQVASVDIANQNAENQFTLAKAGLNSNLAQSEADARTAQIGGQVGMISSLANLLGKGYGAVATTGTTNYADLLKNGQQNQNPAYNPLMGTTRNGSITMLA